MSEKEKVTYNDLKNKLKSLSKNELVRLCMKFSVALDTHIKLSESLKAKIDEMEKKDENINN